MSDNWCRTCLQKVPSIYYKLDYTDSNDIISIRTKLNSIVPNLDLNLVINAVICDRCLNIINTTFTFITQCFAVEDHIRMYSQRTKTNHVNFKDIISFIESGTGTVTTEVTLIKDEDIPLYEPEVEPNHNETSISDNKTFILPLKVNTPCLKKEDVKLAKPHRCTKCQWSFRWLRNLKRHLRTHDNVKPYKCDSCDFKTNRKDALTNHISNKHINKDKPFKCDYCDVHLAQKYALMRHLQTHTDDKPYKCINCDFTCKFKSYLIRHMSIHTKKLKSFKCNVCDYSSFDRKGLNRHLMIHTGEKPFACVHCDYKTSEKSKLKRHEKTHIKEFQCDICHYKTRFKNKLRSHFDSSH